MRARIDARAATCWMAVLALGCGARVEPPPVLGTLPSFSLVDDGGEAFTEADLSGKVWIADFFFTHCPTICPVLTAHMKNLDRRLGSPEGLGLLSVSVDPDHDPPEALRAYAARYGANPARWKFLTGDRAAMEVLVVGGFKVRMGEVLAMPAGDTYDIAHATHFVLLDRQRRIRGYYASDEEGLAKLERDARALLEER